ncbi:MAG: branched-chain amino acid ABC transporter substrate-binding protein [Candidatus Limnocylindrus sp.]
MKVFNKKGFAALAAVALLAAACGGSTTEGKTLTIGISLPLSGSSLASAGPARDGALLAVKETTIEGYTIATKILDHAVDGVHNPAQAATDMTTLVGDETVVAVVGPFNSSSAKAQIPVSSEAGLAQCSPSNTNPDLTKGEAGAALRGGRPVNYVRVAATDDFQGPAVAVYAKSRGKSKVFIVDSTDTYGNGIANAFEAEFIAGGGTVLGREGAPAGTTDFSAIVTKALALGPDAFFYGGVTADGAGLFRKAIEQAGGGDIEFYGGDGIQDGSGEGSYIAIAGAASAKSFSSVAAIENIPDKAGFAAKYEAEYGEAPGAYSAAGYACAQVILDAIKRAVAAGEVTREAVRAAVVDTAVTYSTVLGGLSFDEVGDTSQKVISLYEVVDGNWTFVEQVDYAAK